MGRAIAEYFKTRRAAKLRVFSPMFDEDEIPVETLFRSFEDMPGIERKALDMARGKVLDVGAGSGCHSLVLQQRGLDVTAIDISPLSVETMRQRVEQWYPIIEKYGIPTPKVYIRKMATMWGSCSIKRGAVVFNLYLLKAKIACIDYVVLHELTHFLYPNHSKQFYYFLSNYMPDWKDRKKILDQDVVHGL